MKNINELIKISAEIRLKEKKEMLEKVKAEWIARYKGELKYPYENDTVSTIEDITEQLLDNSKRNIPERYQEATINEDIYNAVGEALKNKKGLYLYGGAGTGKTYALYGAYRILKIKNILCILWNVTALLAELKACYSSDDGEQAIHSIVIDSRILFLDDYGVEKQTEWNTEMMYRIINYRYENMLPTFIASNLSLQELAEKSGDRIASRIAEMCQVIKMDGNDKRIK